jgi:DNA-directed RNA polymerase specialized sigma24 family protein
MKETPLISEDLLKLLVCPKSGGKLKHQIEAIERCVSVLPEAGRNLIELHYFQGIDADTVAAHLHIVKRAVFYRIATNLKDIQYLLGMTE